MTSNKELYAPLGAFVLEPDVVPSPTLDMERYLKYLYSIQESLSYWPAETSPGLKFLEALDEEIDRMEELLYVN